MARPTTEVKIEDLIKSLEKELKDGHENISLSGKGTLHIGGNCILTTESQI